MLCPFCHDDCSVPLPIGTPSWIAAVHRSGVVSTCPEGQADDKLTTGSCYGDALEALNDPNPPHRETHQRQLPPLYCKCCGRVRARRYGRDRKVDDTGRCKHCVQKYLLARRRAKWMVGEFQAHRLRLWVPADVRW